MKKMWAFRCEKINYELWSYGITGLPGYLSRRRPVIMSDKDKANDRKWGQSKNYCFKMKLFHKIKLLKSKFDFTISNSILVSGMVFFALIPSSNGIYNRREMAFVGNELFNVGWCINKINRMLWNKLWHFWKSIVLIPPQVEFGQNDDQETQL